MAEAKFLALDLGAESGRGVIGFLKEGTLRLEDVHRFATGSTRILDTLHWDTPRLFAECKRALGMAVHQADGDFQGVGVDTWGVDFGLFGRGDVLLGIPRHYRDHSTDTMQARAFEIVPRQEIFRRTGIQLMQFNAIFQLLALKTECSPLLEKAETLLFTPDLLHFWFTGVKQTEFSVATTSQCFDPVAGAWAVDLLDKLGIPTNIFTPVQPSGSPVGPLRADIAEELGCGAIPVIAPAGHDTGSAVAAVPADGSDFAYISSGTWSLMGIEVAKPVINDLTYKYNFTNEGGAQGTIRLLKNIGGLWLVQECRRSMMRHGQEYSYAQLTEMAGAASPFVSIIDPDDPAFLSPTDMVHEIQEFCRRSQQAVPDTPGAVIRCCLENLALRYRWTLDRLEELKGARIDRIHIVGGGTQNRLLCQLTADATNREVIAGPVEATAIGNVMIQAMGCGLVSGLAEARGIIRRSFVLETYQPSPNRDEWETAYARFTRLIPANP